MQEATATLLPAASSSASRPITQEIAAPRWRYLILGVVCMVTIANLQYGWTLFVPPLHRLHGWAITEIQISFALFVALETWMTPITG